MRAYYRVSNDGSLLTAIIGHIDGGGRPQKTYTLKAGRGYKWDKDENGLKLIRLSDYEDYHPSSDDVRAGRKHVVAVLRERANTRKTLAKKAKRDKAVLKKASRNGVFICFEDSIKGGNCAYGTRKYAERMNLDIRKHYDVKSLRITNEEEGRRVALAVLAATRRQAKEYEQGFCEVNFGG